MNNICKVILFICLIGPFLIHSQGFQVNLQGQKQQGMGGSGTALMQDASSLFFNPGGSCFVNENSINLGVTPTIARSAFMEVNTKKSVSH